MNKEHKFCVDDLIVYTAYPKTLYQVVGIDEELKQYKLVHLTLGDISTLAFEIENCMSFVGTGKSALDNIYKI